MKIFVQKKITYMIYFILGPVIMSIFLLLDREGTTFEIQLLAMLVFFAIILIIIGVRMLEYAYLTDDGIVVKSIFGVIKKVKWEDVVDCYQKTISISTSRGVFNEECIVLELQDTYPIFKSSENRKKYTAIKINASKKNLDAISKYIKIRPDKDVLEQHKNDFRRKVENLLSKIDDVIELTNQAINEYEEDPSNACVLKTIVTDGIDDLEIYYNQVKKILLPDLLKIRRHIENGGFPNDKTFKLPSTKYIIDSWRFDGEYCIKISELFKTLNNVMKKKRL